MGAVKVIKEAGKKLLNSGAEETGKGLGKKLTQGKSDTENTAPDDGVKKEIKVICEKKPESSAEISKALARLSQDNANIDANAEATYNKLMEKVKLAGGNMTRIDPVTNEPVDLYIHNGKLWMNRENTSYWVIPKDHSEKDQPLVATPDIDAMGRVFLSHGTAKEAKKRGTCDTQANNDVKPGNRTVVSAEDNAVPPGIVADDNAPDPTMNA